jgi:chromosomal replication initiator protein
MRELLCSPCLDHPITAETKILNTNEIVRKVCQYFELEVNKVLGPARYKELVEARHILSYVLYSDRHLTLSYANIGFMLNQRDHSTVVHAVRKINDFLEIDMDYRQKLKDVYLNVYGTLKYYPQWAI